MTMLSLGEAEYNAVVKVSAVALTHGSLYADVGSTWSVRWKVTTRRQEVSQNVSEPV